MNKLAPIVLFVYNRPDHTKQTVEALQKNELASDSELFIYADAAKNENTVTKVNRVREYIKSIDGFKKVTVIEREKNWGLANSIIDGVTNIINKYDKIIVLEDDLVTSPYFLKFMNEGLTIYEDRKDIFSITGFNFPEIQANTPKDYCDSIYLSYRCMSWGWGVWKNRWMSIDWEVQDFDELKGDNNKINKFNRGGEDLFPMLKSQILGHIDSWAIRFCYAHYKNNSYCVYPIESFVSNEGFDGSGVHCNADPSSKYSLKLVGKSELVINKEVQLNNKLVKVNSKIHSRSITLRIQNRIKRYLKW